MEEDIVKSREFVSIPEQRIVVATSFALKNGIFCLKK